MTCKHCNDLGVLVRVVNTLHGKDFRADMCECEEEAIYLQQMNRKDYIDDVHEAAPKSANCSKEGAESPE